MQGVQTIGLAYIARYYYPPSSRKASYFCVYIAGLHGEGRRRITPANQDAYDIAWQDRNHLIVSFERGSKIEERMWDLRTGKSTVLRAEPSETRRGRAHSISSIATRSLYTGGITISRNHPGQRSFHAIGHKVDIEVDPKQIRLTPTGNYDSEGDIQRCAYDPSSDTLWLFSWSAVSTYGEYGTAYQLDWKSGRIAEIVKDVVDLDSDPSRRLFSAVRHRDLVRYDSKRRVWAAKSWVGNWKTGQRWTLTDGIVWTTHVALRPAK